MIRIFRQHALLLATLGACALATGCSSSSSSSSSSGGSSGGSTGSTGTEDAGPNPVIVAERVFNPDGRSYFVSVLDSMPTAEIDRTKAREFTSADIEVFNNKVFIRDRTSNLMTRFGVGADNALVQEAQFSFANAGLGTGRVYSAYLTPTLAYALDGANLKLIGWDPTNMKLTGDSISLSFLQKADFPDTTLGIPTTVGDRVVVPVSWDDEDNLKTNPGIGAMLVLPTNASAQPAVLEDPRAGGGYVVWGFGGDAYIGGTVGGDVKLFGGTADGGAAPASGIVRIKSGESTIDSSYAVDVNAVTGSIGVWGLHLLDPTHLLAQILDPAVDTSTFATPDDYYNSTSFYYVLIDTSTSTVTRQNAIAEGGIGNSQEHVVDGVEYVGVSTDTGTDVYPASPSGIGAKQFDIPSGDLWFAQRLR